MDITRLDELCSELKSNKVRARQGACEALLEWLRQKSAVEFLNENREHWHDYLLPAVIQCMEEDHKKKMEECHKKNVLNYNRAPISVDAFSLCIRIVVRENVINSAEFRSLINQLMEWLLDDARKVFHSTLLKLVSETLLTQSRLRHVLKSNDWEAWFLLLSQLCDKTNESEPLKCLAVVMKLGPSHDFPPGFFQKHFKSVATLCGKVSSSSFKPQQEAILEFVNNFCKHAAKDNRMACCKLGEDIFSNLIELYQQHGVDDLKTDLIEFFLLQVKLHHPKGVSRGHPAAYAVSWEFWEDCLLSLYETLSHEVDSSMTMSIKNQSLFLNKDGVNNLCDNFVELFVRICVQTFRSDSHVTEEPPAKRQKVETNMASLIQKMKKKKKSWAWVCLIGSLLENHPEIVTDEEFSTIVVILQGVQSDTSDLSLLHHINKTLTVLLKIEATIDGASSKCETIWKRVADFALRADPNNEVIQTLLQLLVLKKYITNHEKLLLHYDRRDSLTLDIHNLKTLEIIFKNFQILENKNEVKLNVIRWILSSGSIVLRSREVAQIIVTLILKRSPERDNVANLTFDDLEETYFTVNCQNLLSCEDAPAVLKSEALCADQSLLNNLLDWLSTIINTFGSKSKMYEWLLYTELIFNILSHLNHSSIIKNEDFSDLKLYKNFESNFRNLLEKMVFHREEYDDKTVIKLINFSDILKSLFRTQISDVASKKLRDLVPERLIREMFAILSTEFEDIKASLLEMLKNNVVQCLLYFSCGTCSTSGIQERVLQALVKYDYDCTTDAHYELVLTLLRSFKLCRVTNLSEKTLSSILEIFQKLCQTRYYCYTSVVEILDLFFVVYPFVAASNLQQYEREFVDKILYPFYVRRSSYGPKVSVCLLKCLSLLYELKPESSYFKWQNEEIMFKVPEFLASDFVEIRFAGVKTVAKFFKLSSKMRLLEQYHRQEIMFSKITEVSFSVLRFDEQTTDERIMKSSSVLHTFASVMVSSNLWIEDSLFILIKMVVDKLLDLSSVQKVTDLVAKKLGYKSSLNLFEKYLVGLVNRWKQHDLNFDAFPFQIYKCSSKITLYAKYWSVLAYIFVENEHNLNAIASLMDQSVVEETCPQLLSYAIAQQVSDFALIPTNKIYKFVCRLIGEEKLPEIFLNKIDEIVLCLIGFVSDDHHLKAFFDKNIIFPKLKEVSLSVVEFNTCIKFIQDGFFSGNPLIQQIMCDSSDKIHLILLQLNKKIQEALCEEEKLRQFHLYCLFTELCTDGVVNAPPLQAYLIRDLTHTLLHYIKYHKQNPELSQLSCTLFQKILESILPSLSNVLSQFFLIIISRLKYVALENCLVSQSCVNMLELLIVEHKDLFISEIEKLDSVPETPQFEKIRAVHSDVKYKNRVVTLEDEIIQFLDFGQSIESMEECEHSLTHLRQLLTSRKDELRKLYEQLRQTRGLSEDCERSNLHKLICMLISLSCSSNKNVSVEAARCLGEIGPADLATLILQPEKPMQDQKWSPFELVLGCAITLLSKYLADGDVTVVKAASDALFRIMGTKEGRRIRGSGSDFGFGIIHSEYLEPFCASPAPKTNFNIAINGDSFTQMMSDDDLWIPQHSHYNSWITDVVCTLLETFEQREFFAAFITVCKLKIEFCEHVLPLLINTVLYLNSLPYTTVISQQIESFFNQHWDISVKKEVKDCITTNKSAVQCMLNVVHFVRLQRSVRKKEIKNLQLDYLKVAKGAHFCSAYFTALLYAELWCQEQINITPNDYCLSTSTQSKLDLIYERIDDVTATALQDVLRQSYKSIGESDALLGCGMIHLLNPTTRVEHYKETGRWDLVTHHYEMETLSNQVVPCLVESLKKQNLYQISLFCSNSIEEPNYECLWRLGQWDYKENSVSTNSYDKCKFNALKALQKHEEYNIAKAVDEGRACVIKDFMDANMECIKPFYAAFSRLHCLKECEDFNEAAKSDEIIDLLVKWKIHDDVVANDYQYTEPLQSQRILLLTHLLKKRLQNNDLKDIIQETIISYARLARMEGESEVASRILGNLSVLASSSDVIAQVQLEKAQLCWGIKDVVTAKCILRQLCADENVNPRLHAMALKMSGQWLVESSSENRQTIISDYFQKSLKLLKKCEGSTESDEKTIIDTYHQLAKFSDQEYQKVMAHIKSDIFQKKKRNMEKAKEVINSIGDVRKQTKDQQKAIMIKKKLSCIDETEIDNIEADKNSLLQLALKYYLLNLIRSDDHNMTVFRLFSLLLENRNSDLVKTVLERDLMKVPTYKFINILPQIIPHISSNTSDLFSQTVNNLIEKCAKDHPYHTLPLILSLALANKDREYSESKAVVNDTRTQSAQAILKKLKSGSLSNLIARMELVSEAVIELAYSTSEGCEGRGAKIPKKCKIRKIKNFDDVLLPTYNLPVDKSYDYSGIVGIATFSEVYHNVGGINAPKRITCTGTDGTTRSQLIKGQDDLRQDAVMQQVFTIMNSLLALNKQTKNLRIRTYKIVPLSMRSGILEWVDNTMPIGEYLTGETGSKGAHVQFRPQDTNPLECRRLFKKLSTCKSHEERTRQFNKLCERIQPVFHKFFETTFPQPTVWYERRRTYTHSVATSSMCGYILGIGDRHVNNILIDKTTAEVVHIDFGIAFEQGRVLPTPETVPFRLSRDIVDGMGVSGIEGVFRRSCEKTVEVLRLHHQTIITILEVLLYDPLYDWTVSNAEANKRQKDETDDDLNASFSGGSEEDSGDVNETAERALLRLRAKLQGTESGGSASVEHQVGTLIQQAVDPSNLSRLFYGWQPFL